jgi:hypothetical protein
LNRKRGRKPEEEGKKKLVKPLLKLLKTVRWCD